MDEYKIKTKYTHANDILSEIYAEYNHMQACADNQVDKAWGAGGCEAIRKVIKYLEDNKA